MAATLSLKFLEEKIQSLERSSDHKVCVVGIVGRSYLLNKGALVNRLVDREVISTSSNVSSSLTDKDQKEFDIQIYHDEQLRTIYLTLNSIYDASTLSAACSTLPPMGSQLEYHQYWQHHELNNALAYLFLFSVCHIIVVQFPTTRFELSYLRLFKTLASSRYNMLHSLTQHFNTMDHIPEIWKTTGRPCIPRIIMAFEAPNLPNRGTRAQEQRLKKLQHSLQEQVHLILKKNRLLGSLSSSSLFTVSSPNQIFVHVEGTEESTYSPATACINHVLNHSLDLNSVFQRMRGQQQTSFISQTVFSPDGKISKDPIKSRLTLRQFLDQQIDYMMTVESRDVPAEGRRGTHVEAPTAKLWCQVSMAVYKFLLERKTDEPNHHIKALSHALDINWKFSEARCRKVLPIATNSYIDNLPSHYKQSVHISRLSHAVHVFSLNARGPAVSHYANQLQDECNQVWWNGRQLCEVHSLTGQPCVYPYHQLPDDATVVNQDEEENGIAKKNHSSRVTCHCACNCGQIHVTREDPFDLKIANYTFFEELEKKCCSSLTHMIFPSFNHSEIAERQDEAIKVSETSSFPVYKIAKSPEEALGENVTSPQKLPTSSENQKTESVTSTNTYSIGLNSNNELTDYNSNNEFDDDGDDNNESKVASEKESIFESVTQDDTNTTPGPIISMLTTSNPIGSLPEFPSWSLVVLGPASMYNPSKGVEQQGFFSGSNYLLSWDIPIPTDLSNNNGVPSVDTSNPEEQWPAPGEAVNGTPSSHLPLYQALSKLNNFVVANSIPSGSTNRSDRSKKGQGKDVNLLNPTAYARCRSYIGNEYECPRGHRFFCSGPDKMVKANSSGFTRETSAKLISSDMPLYFPCPCRSAKPLHLARLMRVFVVTPDANAAITLDPKVQPGDKETTPIFYPGIIGGITLPQDSFCVLRLPYVYVGDHGPILPPSDSQPLLTCCIKQGLYRCGGNSDVERIAS